MKFSAIFLTTIVFQSATALNTRKSFVEAADGIIIEDPDGYRIKPINGGISTETRSSSVSTNDDEIGVTSESPYQTAANAKPSVHALPRATHTPVAKVRQSNAKAPMWGDVTEIGPAINRNPYVRAETISAIDSEETNAITSDAQDSTEVTPSSEQMETASGSQPTASSDEDSASDSTKSTSAVPTFSATKLHSTSTYTSSRSSAAFPTQTQILANSGSASTSAQTFTFAFAIVSSILFL